MTVIIEAEGSFGTEAGGKDNGPRGPRMIWDPRCWLHVVLIEYRWIWLFYYTLYVTIIATTRSYEYADEYTAGFMEQYAMCDGLAVWTKKHADLLQQKMWSSSVDESWTADGGRCQVQRGPCVGATYKYPDCSPPTCYQDPETSTVDGCDLQDHSGVTAPDQFYIHMAVLAVTVPFGVGLSLYQICRNHGQFDVHFTANKDYIDSLHRIQIKPWYRTYTNAMFFLIFPVCGFGMYRLQSVNAPQNDILTLIVSALALLQMIPSPRRVAPNKIEYDPKDINNERKSFVEKFVKITNWTSTDYHENWERISKMKVNEEWERMNNICEVPCLCN